MDINAIAEKSGLLPEGECSWEENDVPLRDRGVSLKWLYEFSRAVESHLNDLWKQFDYQDRAARYFDNVPEPVSPEFPRDQAITPVFLVPNVILPLTRKLKSPLYARIPLEHRGKPNLFVSHTWSQGLIGNAFCTLGPITSSFHKHYDGDPYIWIDIVSYNQHLFENIAADMKAVISSIGNVCFPLIDAAPFSRLWCLWEILCAHVTNSEVNICEPAQSAYDMGFVYGIFTEKFRSVSDAETTVPKDKQEILDSMISTFGSIGQTDEHLRKLVERGLTKDSDKPWNKARK